MSQTPQKKRIGYLEVLRTISIFLIIFAHTGQEGVYAYLNAPGLSWLPGGILAILSHSGVYLFFMISGSLLLERRETIAQVWKKRVVRMLIVLVVVSLIHYSLRCLGSAAMTFSAKDLLLGIYQGMVTTTLWYMYVFISFLLVLPILQVSLQGLPDHMFPYLIVLGMILESILPALEGTLGHSRFSLLAFPGFAFVAVLGYYIRCRSGELFYDRRFAWGSFLISMGFLIVSAVWNGQNPYPSLDRFNPIICFGIFVFARYLEHVHPMPGRAIAFWSFLGAGTFGTYLFEEQLRNLTHPVYGALLPHLGTYPASILWILAASVLGILLVRLVKLIPPVGRAL